MPQCQFPIFCCFCVSEKLHRKFSQNWTKPKPDVQMFHGASKRPKRRRSRTKGRPHNQGARPTPSLRRPVVWAPWSTSDAASSPIKTPRQEKPKYQITFLEHIMIHRRHRPEDREGPEALPSILNRHWRSSSSPCLPSWLSSPPCASCLNLVSCLT
jgi:hypothetical protein